MSTTVKEVEILTTLEQDPHVSFFPWESDVQDIAAGMAKSLHPLGLLSAVLTDEQWALYPGNAVPDQQGQIQIVPKYAPPAYMDINNQMSSVDLYVAKATNDKLQLWIDSSEALKRALLKSLGRVVRQIIKPKQIRFQSMSIFEIMVQVRKRYGTMEKSTKSNLEERMMTLLPTADGIDTHISNLQEMFDVSETAGFPVTANRQVEIFRETVCAHPMIVKVLENFDFDFPNSKLVTYEHITAYLILHLPNVKHAQMTATRATANLVNANAYSVLTAESQRLKAENEQLKRKQKDGKNRQKRGKKGKPNEGKPNEQKNKDPKHTNRQARTANEPVANMKYCHGHGYQHSHTSAECKLLAGDKKKYNAEMKRAKGPNHPPGGSTKVNGQHPQTLAANMVTQIDHQHDTDDNEYWEPHGTNDTFDETAVFLANVLRESPDGSYDTAKVTALMTENDSLLFDETGQRDRTAIIPTSAVPRLPLGENLGAPRRVGTVIASAVVSPDPTTSQILLLCPTQAPPAATLTGARSGDSRQCSPPWFSSIEPGGWQGRG